MENVVQQNANAPIIIFAGKCDTQSLAGLFPDYNIINIETGAELLKWLAEADNFPDLFVIDTKTPLAESKPDKLSVQLYGRQLCKTLKIDHRAKETPIILLVNRELSDEEIVELLEVGAIDSVREDQVKTLAHKIGIQVTKRISHKQLLKTREELVRIIGRAVEYKNTEAALHVTKTARYAKEIALAYGVDQEECELIYLAAPLHDIGNVIIPAEILYKKGDFTARERKIMKEHTLAGWKLLSGQTPLIILAKEIALNHHERWDGSGYPRGLKAGAIPLAAQIVALADVFEALTSDRLYRGKWSVDMATEGIKKSAGVEFDQKIVAAFLKARPKFLEIHDSFAKRQE
ncbi:putative two-component system response regulator [Gammaproteobacteria bacterium]